MHVYSPSLATLIALSAALASAARAQTTTSNPSANPKQFGRAACDTHAQVTFNWDFGTLQSGAVVSANLSNDTGCAVPAGVQPLTNIPQTAKGSTSVSASDLVFAQKDGCQGAVSSGQPVTVYFCVKQTVNGTAQTPISATVTYALQAPTAPTALQVSAGDQHLKLAWTQGQATDKLGTYSLYALDLGSGIADTLDGGCPDLSSSRADAGSDAGADAGSDAGPPVNDAGTADAGAADAGLSTTDFGTAVATNLASANTDFSSFNGAALVDGDTYVVAVQAIDTYGNVSDLSAPTCGKPRPIDDFYQHYRQAGGGATGGGGCSTLGGAGWLLALLAFGFLVARRRQKRGALLLLAALALPAPARAAGELADVLRRDERPPRRLLFALKIDRYDPQVDTEAALGGATPYFDVFHGRAPLRWQLEGDWEVAHPFGSLLLGATIGYWQNIGHGVEKGGTTPTADTALLDVLPFGAIATYRFDWAADRFNFPIIPYAQVGLQAALWASFNGRGDVVSRSGTDATNPGGRGSGWTTGWTTALGFAFALDWIDPSLSREAFNDVHIQRTALFAEYGWTHLDGFGKKTALILSDRAWRFGLSLEF